MIERHVTFDVLPGKTHEFEQLFIKEYRPAMSSMIGFVNVELLREHEKSTVYQMVIRFESIDTAAAWRASAAHQSVSPKLKALYSAIQVQVYEVVV